MAKTTKPDFIEPVNHEDPEQPPAATPENEKVSRSNVAPTEMSKPETPDVDEDEDTRPQSYVWLANGEVRRCYNDDLPVTGGGGEYGHWNEGGKVHQIVFIFPVEETPKKG